MISLTGHSRLPQVRLPRADRRDLVFRGVVLARSGKPGSSPAASARSEFVLYETAVGKYILSMSPDTGRTQVTALSFSTLEDVREYLFLEHAGLESMVDDALHAGSGPHGRLRTSPDPLAGGCVLPA